MYYSVQLLVFVCITYVIITPAIVNSQALRWPPSGAKGKKYYMETTYKANWHAAYVACVKNNSRLATVVDQGENSRILEIIKNSNVKNHPFLLGGADLVEEGRWSWLLTGQPVTGFTYWHVGEPNNHANIEHCLAFVLTYGEYKWNDVSCTEPNYFICEYYDSQSILDDCDWKLG